MSIALRDQVIFIDVLRAMGRMSAKERVSYMLLDLIARLPMTQGQIADYLGLTNVYISKTFLRMEQEGLIRRADDRLQILREDDLVELTDFHDRYADMDTSWFPQD